MQFSADLITWETSAILPDEIATDGTVQVVSVAYPLLTGGVQAHFFKVAIGVAP